jgi:hypothetical protein
VFGARFTPAGRLLAYVVTQTTPAGNPLAPANPAGADPRFDLAVRDAVGGEPVWSSTATFALGQTAVSADGRRAAVVGNTTPAGGAAFALQVWDVEAGRPLWTLPPAPAWPDCDAVFSPDGGRLLTVPLDAGPGGEGADRWRHQAVVWDAATGRVVCAFDPPAVKSPFGLPTRESRSRFVFSADGRRLASFGAVPGIKVWDAADGRELFTLGGPGVVTAAAFSPDGWLVTLGREGAITVWDGRATAGPGQPPAAASEQVKQARAAATDPARAVALAREAVRAYPNRSSFWGALGLAQVRSGDARSAVPDLERALALAPGPAEGVYCFALAQAHARLGEPDSARQWFDRGERWRAEHGASPASPVKDEMQRARAEAAALLNLEP